MTLIAICPLKCKFIHHLHYYPGVFLNDYILFSDLEKSHAIPRLPRWFNDAQAIKTGMILIFAFKDRALS